MYERLNQDAERRRLDGERQTQLRSIRDEEQRKKMFKPNLHQQTPGKDKQSRLQVYEKLHSQAKLHSPKENPNTMFEMFGGSQASSFAKESKSLLQRREETERKR